MTDHAVNSDLRPATGRGMRPARLAALLSSALVAAPGLALAQTAAVPLEGSATRMVNFETANMLPGGTWSLQAGSHQTDPSVGAGTGAQVYYGAFDYAVNDRLTFGFTTQVQEDKLIRPILGGTPATRFLTAGASVKYRFADTGRVKAAALASVEYLDFSTGLFGTTVSDNAHAIGAFQVPVSVRVNPNLQFHVTPGVSVFPGDLNGLPYYGTVAHLGLGATWQPNPRFQAYATVQQPLSGGNTIDTSRNIVSKPVYTLGARYSFTPKVALEGYVTNGLGISPATGILTFYPDGTEPLFGLKVHYTPGRKLPASYRPMPLAETTARDRQLQQDGFILSYAGVLDPGHLRLNGSVGGDDNYAVAGALSTDRDFQFDGAIEKYADNGSVPGTLLPTRTSARWMAGGRIRVLDQSNGDPVSFTARVLGGRDLDTLDVGVLFVAFPLTYEINDRLAVTAAPAAALWGNTEILGLGLGANYHLGNGVQLLAEVTPVSDGDSPVWAAGARYTSRNGALSVDLSATNSIGRYGLGTLLAQDEVRYSVGVSLTTGLFAR